MCTKSEEDDEEIGDRVQSTATHHYQALHTMPFMSILYGSRTHQDTGPDVVAQ